MKSGESGKPLRVHDLVLLSTEAGALLSERAQKSGVPWVFGALEDGAWAVVRRITTGHPDEVAVGIRGERREQRWAAVVPRTEVREAVSPKELLRCEPAQSTMPVFQALRQIQRPDLPVDFGPGGSAGFELATGRPTVNDSSDLDLVLSAPQPLSDETVVDIDRVVQETMSNTGVEIDILVETAVGGVAFAELSRAVGMHPKPTMVVRTASGPLLVEDPWKDIAK